MEKRWKTVIRLPKASEARQLGWDHRKRRVDPVKLNGLQFTFLYIQPISKYSKLFPTKSTPHRTASLSFVKTSLCIVSQTKTIMKMHIALKFAVVPLSLNQILTKTDSTGLQTFVNNVVRLSPSKFPVSSIIQIDHSEYHRIMELPDIYNESHWFKINQ